MRKRPMSRPVPPTLSMIAMAMAAAVFIPSCGAPQAGELRGVGPENALPKYTMTIELDEWARSYRGDLRLEIDLESGLEDLGFFPASRTHRRRSDRG
jgi:hypothetical protein